MSYSSALPTLLYYCYIGGVSDVRRTSCHCLNIYIYIQVYTHPFPYCSPANVHLLDGNAADLQAECDRYESLIQQHGGIEMFLGK